MRISKKITALFIAVMMVVSAIPFTASAATATVSSKTELEDAIAAASSGDTIQINDNITGNFTIPVGLDIEIDLNGNTITASSTGTPVFTNRGTLNIYGGTIVNNGYYFPEFLGDGGVAVMNYGVATVNVTTNKGAIVNRSTSSTTPNLTIAGGSYTGNPLALATEDGSYTVINDGDFSAATGFVTANSGGTVEVNDGEFNCLGTESESTWIVNGGEIDAITVDSGSENILITITDGEIASLPSTSAVEGSTDVTVTVSGGTFDSAVPEAYCAENFTPATEPNEQGKYEVVAAGVNDGVNISIGDTISENFYIAAEHYGADAYATVTYNHSSDISEDAEAVPSTDVIRLSTLPVYSGSETDYVGDRVITIKQAPAQITEDIVLKIYANQDDAENGENVEKTVTYNTAAYCESIITGDYSAALKELAEATLDYAAASQVVFGYNTENMAKDTLRAKVDEVDFAGVDSISDPNVLLKSVSLVAKSNLEINLISKYDLSVSSSSINATSGKDNFAVTTYPNGDFHVIHIAGIEPANMNKTITVNTSLGTIRLTANAVMKVMAQNGTGDMSTFAKAMYLYGAAANAYFG